MSSRGYLVDEIESIGEKICLASHLEEQLRASDDEEEQDELRIILKEVLGLRRKQMSNLLSEGEKPNPKYHCAFKHSLGGFCRDVEVFEATLEDKDLEIAKESANIFAMVCSKYLGLEFETCARCLADRLAVLEYDRKHQSDTMKIDNGGKENG